MAAPLTIELPGEADAADLVHALAVRGLTAAVERSESGSRVGIRYGREETGRLLVDLLAALESWSADRSVAWVAVRVGARALPPGPAGRRKVSTGPAAGMVSAPDPLPRRRSSR